MAWLEYLTNNYSLWPQISGYYTLYSGDSCCYIISDESTAEWTDTIYKTFILEKPANDSELTVDNFRSVGFGADSAGIASCQIILGKPSGPPVVLYSGSGNLPWSLVLDKADITAHLQEAGTYTLYLVATVKSGYTLIEGNFTWFTSEVHWGTVDLDIEAGATVEKEFLESVEVTEQFKVSHLTQRFLESVAVVESFSILKATPPTPSQRVIFVATSADHKVHLFEEGAPPGYFDSPEIDYGIPGEDKTLEEVQCLSDSPTPHTVSLYVSTNAGKTWTSIGSTTIYRGVKGFIYPYITAESFVLRFAGDALHLFSYTAYARPSGLQVRSL